MIGPERTRVLSIPADHPYVRHTLGVVDGVVVLDDPTTPWWPPCGLDPAWVARHRSEFDLIHVHFGFEQIPIEQLRAWCVTTADLGVPVVVTAHDLRNPHLADNAAHELGLEVLLDRADAVITLTNGAADEIRRRYHKEAVVLAHPHLLPLDHPVGPTQPRKVGVYYGIGRANTLPPRSILPALASGCVELGAALQVSAHAHARTELLEALGELQSIHHFDLRIAPRSSDDVLFADVASLHVAVLPYRFGTHSGWIELCRDVGTRVIAPDSGHYADQWDEVETFSVDSDQGADGASLHRALQRALRRAAPWPADRQWRSDQRDATGESHRAIYASVTRRDSTIAATR